MPCYFPWKVYAGCQAQRQPLLSALPMPVLHQCQHTLTRGADAMSQSHAHWQ